MALAIYRAPDGTTWQYERGTQPRGYVEVRARRAPNKSRRSADKGGAGAKEGA